MLPEHQQLANLCLHAICPHGFGTHVHRSGTRSLLDMLLPGLSTAVF